MSRRDSYADLDATMIAGTGAGGSLKGELVVSASERSYTNIVPSGSQQTDHWQDVFP